MPLEPRDHELSMRISPRARRPENNLDLRTLIVHRLADSQKAIGRIPLRREGRISYYCEPCGRWTSTPTEVFEHEWKCPHCNRLYAMEFAVMEELDTAEDDDEPDVAVRLPASVWRSVGRQLRLLAGDEVQELGLAIADVLDDPDDPVVAEILAHADEAAKRFEDYEPAPGQERTWEEVLEQRARYWRQELGEEGWRAAVEYWRGRLS